MFYNDQLAFGIVKIEKKGDFREKYQIVKCNNMIRYLLWDINPPGGQAQPTLRGQLFTLQPQYVSKRPEEIAKTRKLQVICL
jgi:hypothetical protein